MQSTKLKKKKNFAFVGHIVPTAVDIRLPQNVGNVLTSFS